MPHLLLDRPGYEFRPPSRSETTDQASMRSTTSKARDSPMRHVSLDYREPSLNLFS